METGCTFKDKAWIHLQRYEHVARMEDDDPVKAAWGNQVEGSTRGRQRIQKDRVEME